MPTASRVTAKKKAPQSKTAKKPTRKAAKKVANKPAGTVTKKTTRKPVVRTAKQKAFVKKKPSTPAPAQEIGPEVLELIAALDAYKLKYNRPFPGWSEVLYVLKGLGYSKP